MPNYSRIVILCSVFGIAIFTGILCWDAVNLPFSNPWEITGPLIKLQYNPANNLVRFVMFILLPVAMLLILYISGKIGYHIISFALHDRPPYIDQNSTSGKKQSYLFSALLLCFIIASSLSIPTYHANGPLDTFHEGESLGPAISYMNGLIPYKDYVFAHGVIQDPLRSVFAFLLFGKSIGAVRSMESIISLITLIMLGVFLLQFYHRNAFYVFASTWILFKVHIDFEYLSNAIMIPIIIPPRDIMTMVFLLTLPFIQKMIRKNDEIQKQRKPLWSIFFFSFIPMASFAYSIDRGFYLSTAYAIATLLLYGCHFHKIQLRFQFIRAIGCGLLLGIFALGTAVKFNFAEFFRFTFLIMPRYKELMDGYVFPIHDPKFLFVCVVIAFNLYWMAYKFLQEFSESNEKMWPAIAEYLKKYLMEFILLLLSVFFFRSALGRADWVHVAYSSYPAYILFLSIMFKYQFHRLLSRFVFNKRLLNILLILIVFQISITGYEVVSKSLVRDKFPIRRSDASFIPDNYKATIRYLKQNLNKDEYFVTMTSEAIWYYFIDKPCPIRFPVIWFAMPPFYQREVIADMKKNNVKYIIYKNAHWANAPDGFTNNVRLPAIIHFIQEYYQIDMMIDDNEIWVRKS